jgi:hypothetical protein
MLWRGEGAHLLCKPRQCLIYKGPARRASVHATLQPAPLEIVVPCGSPGYGLVKSAIK